MDPQCILNILNQLSHSVTHSPTRPHTHYSSVQCMTVVHYLDQQWTGLMKQLNKSVDDS